MDNQPDDETKTLLKGGKKVPVRRRRPDRDPSASDPGVDAYTSATISASYASSSASSSSSAAGASALSTGLGVTKDAAGMANMATKVGFDAAHVAADTGFGAGRMVMRAAVRGGAAAAAACVAAGAAGYVSPRWGLGLMAGATALKVAEVGVGIGHWATLKALWASKALTTGALSAATGALGAVGVEDGASLRLLFGDEAGAAMMFVRNMVFDFAGDVPADMTLSRIRQATRALSMLQAAAWRHPRSRRVPSRPSRQSRPTSGSRGSSLSLSQSRRSSDDLDLPAVRRYMRFALGCYGHLGLKALRIVPAIGGPASNEAAIEYMTGIDAAEDVVRCQ